VERLRVELADRSYDIAIGTGTLDALGDAVRGLSPSPRLALVSNPTVHALYGPRVRDSLTRAGFAVHEVTVPDGEQYKTLLWTEKMLTELLRSRLDRRSVLVALGGGVIGDMAGFAAALYMRGIRFVQVPTTLLAQVDSSVGGKTGVNHPLGKNMIGAFWQPSLVWVDLETLRSLPPRQFRAGMAEVIKYGVIRDEAFFRFLGEHEKDVSALEPEALAHLVRRSCEIKAEVVSRDEREAGLRAILNYGHTIGHAVETATGYGAYLHGEAVAIGMCAEARLAEAVKVAAEKVHERVRRLVELYGLPAEVPEGLEAAALLEAMHLDKKALSGEMRFILPVRVGTVRVNEPVPAEAVQALLSTGSRPPSP
jgi:3-dehydroquinate synthase